MSFVYDVNNATMTGAQLFFNLKELLKSAGWTVPSSSDGTTYNSSGDQITTGSSGGGGMANNSAWYRIRMPSVSGITREFTIQRSTTNLSWTINYSYLGFTGGSPNATTTPTATDQGSVASGTILPADSGYRWNAAADNDGDDGWAFWCTCFPTGGGAVSYAFILDTLMSGTYPSTEPEPYVIYSSSNLTTNIATTVKGYLGKGTIYDGFVSLGGCAYFGTGAADTVPGFLGTNPYTSLDEILPIPYARFSSTNDPAGYKGMGKLMKWNGSSRTTGDTFSLSTTRDRIVMSNVNLPWDGSVPTV